MEIENKTPFKHIMKRDEKSFFCRDSENKPWMITRYCHYPEQEFLGVDQAYLDHVEQIYQPLSRLAQEDVFDILLGRLDGLNELLGDDEQISLQDLIEEKKTYEEAIKFIDEFAGKSNKVKKVMKL